MNLPVKGSITQIETHSIKIWNFFFPQEYRAWYWGILDVSSEGFVRLSAISVPLLILHILLLDV